MDEGRAAHWTPVQMQLPEECSWPEPGNVCIPCRRVDSLQRSTQSARQSTHQVGGGWQGPQCCSFQVSLLFLEVQPQRS